MFHLELDLWLDIETKFPYFLFLTWLSKNINHFVSISSLTDKCAAQKINNFCSCSLWTCLHHMVILKSQNKLTDFFMILVWARPFKYILDTSCAHSVQVDI